MSKKKRPVLMAAAVFVAAMLICTSAVSAAPRTETEKASFNTDDGKTAEFETVYRNWYGDFDITLPFCENYLEIYNSVEKEYSPATIDDLKIFNERLEERFNAEAKIVQKKININVFLLEDHGAPSEWANLAQKERDRHSVEIVEMLNGTSAASWDGGADVLSYSNIVNAYYSQSVSDVIVPYVVDATNPNKVTINDIQSFDTGIADFGDLLYQWVYNKEFDFTVYFYNMYLPQYKVDDILSGEEVFLMSSEWSDYKWPEVRELLAANGGQSAAPPVSAAPTSSTVLVNGESVSFDAYNIGGNNFFKLRDLAHVLSGTDKQFEVGYDSATKAITLTGGKPYTDVGGEMTGKGTGSKTPTATASKITLDGKEVSFTAYNIEGNNYFKLRDIASALNFGVTWDAASKTIGIDTSTGYTPE